MRRVSLRWVALAGAALALSTGLALAAQPHMNSALADLQAARRQLEVAIHDKGGHRVQAIGLVDQAIEQVREGIAAGA